MKTSNKPYNGHKNYNHWNVSLWINNDEGLYALAMKYIRAYPRQKDIAAQVMLEHLHNVCKTTTTPDGAPYSKSSIRAAIVGM